MNNNNHNAWICQPLYTGDLWEVSPRQWEYEPVLTRNRDTNEIEVNFNTSSSRGPAAGYPH